MGPGGSGPVEAAAGGPGPVEGGPDPLEVASDEAGPGEPDRVVAAPDEVGSAGPDLGAVTQATAGESGGAGDVPRRQLAGRRRATVAPEPAPELSDPELRGALEAILLVVDEPVSELVLAQVLEQPAERVGPMLDEIAAGYTAAGHGFELRRAAGGWRLYTRPEYATYVERFVLDGQSVRLTQAALETLAVVAYKQPVTRSRISAIRGVNCDGVIRTLVTRGLIEECGTETDSGAFLYRTTTLFLEKLGLNTVDELPPLAPFLPDDVEELADATR
ncbi:SMC-Scp complex subunit ScpB [Micromonospora saelicesensis]|uniref:SMC-Scp complex subunit ScpB n=1 Tax=Micromonospora saelicesensis TaxID=285676 RepID=UPI003D8E8902